MTDNRTSFEDWERLRKEYEAGLTPGELAVWKWRNLALSRTEAAVLVTALEAGRRGFTVADVLAGPEPVSRTGVYLMVRLYLSSGTLEPAGLLHRVPLGRRMQRVRITAQGRRLANMYARVIREVQRLCAQAEKERAA